MAARVDGGARVPILDPITERIMSSERGIALIMVMLLTAFLSTLGAGLILAVFMDRLATGNMSGSIAMLHAADASIELAARDLSQVADWNSVLTGARRSTFTDGAPNGVRGVPGGGTVNLTAATNMLNCGKTSDCTLAQMNANSRDRPWGVNNPRWQLYAFGAMEQFTELSQPAPIAVKPTGIRWPMRRKMASRGTAS
jgi:hypothetical protein